MSILKPLKITALFYMPTKTPNIQGEMPIYLRITIRGRRRELSTGIYIKPTQWTKYKTIKGNNVKSLELQEIKTKMEDVIFFFRNRHDFTLQDVVLKMGYSCNELNPENTLGKLCKMWSELFAKQVSIGEKATRTIETYQSYHKFMADYFSVYKEVQTFKASDFEDFRLHLRGVPIMRGHNTGQNLGVNYVAKILQHFKKLFEYAYEMDWITKHPFQFKRSPRTKPEKLFLHTEQLEALQKLHTEDKATNEAIEIFCFCAFTGLSYLDYCALQPSNIIKEKGALFIILEYRQKSPIANRYGKSYIPIFPEALAILQKYAMNPVTMPRPESHVLNRHLKFAWGLIDASPKICIKHARHTFINWARNEKSLHEGTIATIVGHASLRTTEQHYLNRGLDTVIKDLQKLNLLLPSTKV